MQLQRLLEEYLYFTLSLHASMELGVPELQEWNYAATRKLPSPLSAAGG
jgi:hypothetical protein